MDKHNFVQRPGGLGPDEPLKALGSPAPTTSASLYQVTPSDIALRRAFSLDDVNRIYTQYSVDRGEYARAPIGPVNYGEGNIMPSNQPSGPAGYNHRGQMVTPERAMDMSKANYLVKESNKLDPNLRAQMQILTVNPTQNFYNVQDPHSFSAVRSYTMPDSLPVQQVIAGQRMSVTSSK